MKNFFRLSAGAQFSEYDFLMALNKLSKEPLGRPQLIKELNLSEASTRSLMKKLTDLKYANVTTKGLSLTKKGKQVLKELSTQVSEPEKIDFSGFSVAFKVKNSAHLINIGVEQRDAAVKEGASGAMVLVYRDNKLIIPGVEGSELVYFNILSEAGQKFLPEEGDVIVIAFADNEKKAGSGAWAAVKTLV